MQGLGGQLGRFVMLVNPCVTCCLTLEMSSRRTSTFLYQGGPGTEPEPETGTVGRKACSVCDCTFYVLGKHNIKEIPLCIFVFKEEYLSQKAADVCKTDVWDFQVFSQTFLELRFSLENKGKDSKNRNSQTWPGTPRRPSPRHPRPSD